MIAVTQQWGLTGFQEHCSKMQRVYQNRASIMHHAAIRVCCTIPVCFRHLAVCMCSHGTFRILALLVGILSFKHGCTTSIMCTMQPRPAVYEALDIILLFTGI